MQTLTATQLKERLADGERLQLVDVRTPAEYARGHVSGALNLPMDEIDARADDLSARDTIVLICQSGSRAGIVCAQLAASYGNLAVLDGGTIAWTEAGLPVVGSISRQLPILRQTQLIAGLLVLSASLLSLLVRPGWIALAFLVGGGLTLAGSTGFCPMAALLARMPWNRVAARVG